MLLPFDARTTPAAGDDAGAGFAQRQLGAERRVLDLLAADRPLQEILTAICVSFDELAPGARCSILLLDPTGTKLLDGAGPSLPDAYRKAIHGISIGDGVGSCGTAAFLNKQVVVSSIATDPLWADFTVLARSHGLEACWSTPINGADGSVLGTFAIYYGEARSPGAVEFAIIERAQSLASLAISRTLAAAALSLERERSSVALGSISDGVITTDVAGHVAYMNPVAEELTGWRLADAKGHPLAEVFTLGQPHVPEALPRVLAQLTSGAAAQHLPADVPLMRRDGVEFHVENSLTAIRDGSGAVAGALLVFRDVSGAREMNLRLAHRAAHDALTDLPNRALLVERCEQALARARESRTKVALLLLDLDGFKEINDSLGHAGGDALLRGIADRLCAAVRPGDTVSRIGADEFIVLMPSVGGYDAIEALGRDLVEAVAAPCDVEGRSVDITASLGISAFPEHGESCEALIRSASAAMRHAKSRGRNNYQIFTPQLEAKVAAQLALHASLRRGLERGEFLLHYQPQLSLASGKITGVEALVRWLHPQRGLVPPTSFIPSAEEAGFMIPLGDWVLGTACAQAAAWQAAGIDVPSVAVNVSAAQFLHHDFPGTVARVLQETGLEPRRLELELTESVAMRDVCVSMAILGRLKKMGVRLALDDFGTGYSSLSYLRSLAFDSVKVDQSFVRDIAAGPDAATLVVAIIQLAQNLRLKVVAEGVETAEQESFLRDQHCDEIQGDYFCEALSANDAAAFLRERTIA